MTFAHIDAHYPDCDRIEDIAKNMVEVVDKRRIILQTKHKGVLVQVGPSDTPLDVVSKFNRDASRFHRPLSVVNTQAVCIAGFIAAAGIVFKGLMA